MTSGKMNALGGLSVLQVETAVTYNNNNSNFNVLLISAEKTTQFMYHPSFIHCASTSGTMDAKRLYGQTRQEYLLLFLLLPNIMYILTVIFIFILIIIIFCTMKYLYCIYIFIIFISARRWRQSRRRGGTSTPKGFPPTSDVSSTLSAKNTTAWWEPSTKSVSDMPLFVLQHATTHILKLHTVHCHCSRQGGAFSLYPKVQYGVSAM